MTEGRQPQPPLWSPERRAAMSALVRARMADPEVRARNGYLSDSERALIVSRCLAGAVYADVADDWLISLSSVTRIAQAAGVRRQGPERTMKCAHRFNRGGRHRVLDGGAGA